MGKFWFAATAVMAGLACAAPATAQRVRQDGRWVSMPHRTPPRVSQHHGNRWPMHNGRWQAGWQAPGGWGAYHRLGRGARLPGYWQSYRVPDYLNFGLAAPPRGYNWVRYYDDAVLVDDGGLVWDSVGGIGWSGAESSYGGSFSNSESYSSVSVGAPYAAPIAPVDPNGYYDGYDGYEDGGADYGEPIPAPYDGGYPPVAPPIAPPPPTLQVQPLPSGCIQACGGGYQSGGYYSSGGYSSVTYGYGAPSVTTVIVSAPVVTTTTTVTEEVIEESVTSYVRSPRKVVRRAAKKYRRPTCVCR